MVRAAVPGTAVATFNRQSDDHTSIRTALADLYVAGALNTAHAPGAPIELPPQRPLPSHRFQRTRMWSVEQLVADDLFGSSDARALPGDPIEPGQTEWRTELAAARLPWLRDHAVEDMVVLPGAAYIDAALAAAAELTGRSAPALEDVRFVTPLVLEDNDIPVLRLTADPASGRFSVSSRSGSASGWTRHAHGRIVDGLLRPTLNPPNFTARVRVSADQLYPRLADRGLVYGPQFRRIVYAEVDDGQVVARVDATAPGIDASNHQAHPTVVDAALQCVALLVDGSDAADGAVVPAGRATCGSSPRCPTRFSSPSLAVTRSRMSSNWSPMWCYPISTGWCSSSCTGCSSGRSVRGDRCSRGSKSSGPSPDSSRVNRAIRPPWTRRWPPSG